MLKMNRELAGFATIDPGAGSFCCTLQSRKDEGVMSSIGTQCFLYKKKYSNDPKRF